MSAISCLNMNGMVGTSHNSSSKKPLLHSAFPVFHLCSLFLLPPVSQSLDWVLMTVAADHLGRPRSQLGAPWVLLVTPPFALSPSVLSLTKWGPAPILSGPEKPQTLGLLLVTPVCPMCDTPIPPCRSALPHSALCSCWASPIPPHVALISTQRTSVKTTNYVDTRAEFTQKLHTQPPLKR